MSDIQVLLDLTFVFSTILIVATLAGYISEKVGIINIGIDGMMCVGALFFGIFASEKINLVKLNAFGLIIAITLAMFCTTILGWLHGFLCITLKANHTVSGTAINLLGFGFTTFLNEPLARKLYPKLNYSRIMSLFNSDLHIKDSLYGTSIILFIFALLLCGIIYFIMKKTTIGLRYLAIGENPHAANAKGIKVIKYKWVGVILSSLLAGMAGALFLFRTIAFNGNVQSMGYLALAILIVGGWNIGGIITFGIIFAIFIASANTTTLIQLGINQLFVFALPYIITLIILLFTSNKIIPPASAGRPFISEERE